MKNWKNIQPVPDSLSTHGKDHMTKNSISSPFLKKFEILEKKKKKKKKKKMIIAKWMKMLILYYDQFYLYAY